MGPIQICLLIIAGLLLFGVGFYFFSIAVASYIVYTKTLKRENKEKWSREPAEFPNALYKQMDILGQQWHKENLEFKQEVHIVNEGLNLYGEYYNFGFSRSVMVLSGRTESLRYGYFFAKPYKEAGYNVLVFDPRAHGKSDGTFNTVGFDESKDVLAWAKHLHEDHKVEQIIFHGICIGAAAGMYAITSEECPEYICGIVTEGMFPNFGESMKNHLIERKKLLFPIREFIDGWMKHYTHHSMTYGPINVIGTLTKPILMIHSKMDKYSLVENAQIMYDMCPSKAKRLVLYETGDHSMLRITDTVKYDDAIKTFIKDNW